MKHPFIALLLLIASTFAVAVETPSPDSRDEAAVVAEKYCVARWGNQPYQEQTGYGPTCSHACSQAMYYCRSSAGPYNAQYCRVSGCYDR